MDKEKLLARLMRSKVIFGDVKDTVPQFIRSGNPAPIAAIFHDLDFYSSTMDALKILEIPAAYRLPRIFHYFDDVVGDEVTLYNQYTGQLAAIESFNGAHEHQKLVKPEYLKLYPHHDWTRQIYIAHDFTHPLYNQFISDENQQLPL